MPLGHRTFLRRALRRPDLMGAPAPTGAALAAEIAAVVPDVGTPTVVELGAGTGALSDAIHARLAPGSRYVAVEVDAEFVAYLHRTRPWLEVLHGDAADLTTLLAEAGVGTVDAIISSLPWTLLPPTQRHSMLTAAAGTLGRDGVFATIITLTAIPDRVRDLVRCMEDRFIHVEATAPVWRNLPPARLYVCRGPRHAALRADEAS
ncbi:class I SAM-dependent methyltransferase [Pseudonocardia sp. T1-2H]|uniref:class I SAM-dependent methyltransferase n=1 Tax=Pseudonocardia sp. T1-2H TaxID=3128899 RepID=UPI0031010D84